MTFEEALDYAIDNEITFRFQKEGNIVKLIAYQLPFRAVAVDGINWTFRQVFNNAILPALDNLKTQSQT